MILNCSLSGQNIETGQQNKFLQNFFIYEKEQQTRSIRNTLGRRTKFFKEGLVDPRKQV